MPNLVPVVGAMLIASLISGCFAAPTTSAAVFTGSVKPKRDTEQTIAQTEGAPETVIPTSTVPEGSNRSESEKTISMDKDSAQPVKVLGKSLLAKGKFESVDNLKVNGYVFDRDNPSTRRDVSDNSFGIQLGTENRFAFEGSDIATKGMIRRFSVKLKTGTVVMKNPVTGVTCTLITDSNPVVKLSMPSLTITGVDASTVTKFSLLLVILPENIAGASVNSELAKADFTSPTATLESSRIESIPYDGALANRYYAVKVKIELTDNGYVEYNPVSIKIRSK